MKDTFKYIGISLLFILSLIYTDKISYIIKSKDPIMIQINEISDKEKVESVDAVINNNEIIPGKMGCNIDINKSYENMKKINEYRDTLLKYNDLIPNISITNIYNKYISKGNSSNRNVSIVIYIKDDVEKLNSINDIKVNVFLDSNMFNNKIDVNNKKIYNGGINNIYDDITIEYINNIIEDNYNKSNYCLNINKYDDSLLVCSKNRMYSIVPNIKVTNILKAKSSITNGSIIYFDENNIDKIENISNFILSKGYNIVYLDELLSEKSCK